MAKWDIAVIGVAALGIIYLLRQTGKDIAGAVENIKMPDIRMPEINIPGYPDIKIQVPNTVEGAKGNLQTGLDIATYPFKPILDVYKDVWGTAFDKLSGWWQGGPEQKKVVTPPSSSYFPPSLGGADKMSAVSPSRGTLEERMFSSPFAGVFSVPPVPAPSPGVEFHKAAWDKLAPPVPSPSLDYTGQGGGNYSSYQQPIRAPLSPRSGWTYDSLAAAIRESGLGLTQANFGNWYIPGTFVGDPVSGGGSIDTGSIYEQVKLRL